MSTRRRSSRATNATFMLEQQRIDKALKRTAGFHGPEPRLEHAVLSDQKCAPVWNVFLRYATRSPRIQQGASDISTPAGGRAQRRRAPQIKLEAGIKLEIGQAAEDDGGASMADPLAPAAAAAAAEAAKAWDADGHHVIDSLQPLLSLAMTAPLHIQEALMHMVLNAGAHSGSTLPERAYRVLMQLLEWHPPAKLQDGELRINDNLWAPVGCSWQAEPHKDKPRLSALREAGGLAALVVSAHNCVVRAAEAAGAPKQLLPKLATGAPEGDELGEIMLLKYWVKMLQVDLDARMGLMRLNGFRPRKTSILENSLVYRLMQTFINWSDGSSSKPQLIRHLAATVVTAHMATTHAHGNLAAAAEGAAGGSDAGAAGGTGALPPHLISPAEVGSLAGSLLSMLYDVYGSLDRMWFYVRQGAQGRDNDLVRMDLVMTKAIPNEPSYSETENLRVLMCVLPPAAAVRLLVYMLTDAASRRVEVGEQLAGGLRAVLEHYADLGVDLPPKIRASDALHYLHEEPQRQTGGSNWNWALSYFSATRLALMVTQLTTSALQQAQQEVRWRAAAAPGGGAGGGGGVDVKMENVDDGLGEEDEPGVWEAEAAAVAAAYRLLAERLRRDGVYDDLGAADCTAVMARCTERLVGRVEAGGLTAGVMPLRV
ncbi:hypothetical protein PLESTB_001609700 [Pleodorina starrii]|uniref:Uncharacterized protein n=1 Tax=Pleodorina starrii TaxID=330485 RepID=A0A9W6BY54_9CHLO|nr:hypothetical protein PLESTB_001609700 [Pleodorina starrii]GLC64143.1 hypothetical protein PLESTF_000129100 [Pleodorina starrii]